MPGLTARRANLLTAKADAMLSGMPLVIVDIDGRITAGQIVYSRPARAREKTTLAAFNSRTRQWQAPKPRDVDGAAVITVERGKPLPLPEVLAFTARARKDTADKVRKGTLPRAHADAIAAERLAAELELRAVAMRAGVLNTWTGR